MLNYIVFFLKHINAFNQYLTKNDTNKFAFS